VQAATEAAEDVIARVLNQAPGYPPTGRPKRLETSLPHLISKRMSNNPGRRTTRA
jgi:hypothetical protein